VQNMEEMKFRVQWWQVRSRHFDHLATLQGILWYFVVVNTFPLSNYSVDIGLMHFSKVSVTRIFLVCQLSDDFNFVPHSNDRLTVDLLRLIWAQSNQFTCLQF
jgi:hypothetical protein